MTSEFPSKLSSGKALATITGGLSENNIGYVTKSMCGVLQYPGSNIASPIPLRGSQRVLDSNTAPPTWPLILRGICVHEGEQNRSDRSSRIPVFKTIVWIGARTTEFPETALSSAIRSGPMSDPDRESCESDKVVENFERRYAFDPEGAVSRLLRQVTSWEGGTTLGVSPVQVAAILMSHLPGAAYGRQNLLVDALKRFASPRAIVQGALTVSHTPSGPDVLEAAAGLLEHYASDAWPTLEQLAFSDRPECRYFVRQIATCEGISEYLRIQALARLALNPDPDTRREVAEALESGFLHDPAPVWQALASARENGIDRAEVITKW